jgi:hypothetical protein
MYFISHRGNLHGPKPKHENSIPYILNAIQKGFDVEIDVWYVNGSLYLGHNEPQYLVPEFKFFKDNAEKLWCHCKNLQALDILLPLGIHCFIHDKDIATLTSKNYIWLYPSKMINVGNNENSLNDYICKLNEIIFAIGARPICFKIIKR